MIFPINPQEEDTGIQLSPSSETLFRFGCITLIGILTLLILLGPSGDSTIQKRKYIVPPSTQKNLEM